MQTLDISEKAGLQTARQQLAKVARSYASRRVAAVLLPMLVASILLAVLARTWPAAGWLWAGVAAAGATLALWPLRAAWRSSPATAARLLNRHYPPLEDSAGLLLQDPAALPLLGQLQQERVAQQLAQLLADGPALLPVRFKNPLLLSGGLLALSLLVWLLPYAKPMAQPASVPVHFNADHPHKTTKTSPARIEQVRLLVTPPAYTRRPAFVPAQASFRCPQGARVRWEVRVSGDAPAGPQLEIGGKKLALRPVAGAVGTFAAEQVVGASALYRLRYAGQVSDDYAIEAQADEAPVVRVQSPKPYTLIAAVGTRPEVPVHATLRDDYGLTRAELVITVAKGQGEAVKFTETRRDLSAALGGQPTKHSISQVLNLPKLGLTFGDELYFYIQAQDNHGQSSRSDTYLVQWQDTAAAASALDMGLGVNTAPAYFRSQRQVIIDTEKLLAEQKKLTPAELANRANALGFDQQSLRLRYGKFLGEENEKAMGASAPPLPIAEDEETPAAHAAEADHDHDDHAAPPRKAGGLPSLTAETDALADPYIHKHDDAETADFLEPAVKAKLHAVLDEMWAAELRLRTGQLAAARPYEYRALRLLKEVQQQTRAYVRKAGFVPPPLPEATLRLTGELKGAAAPHLQATVPAPTAQPAVRAALRWLGAAAPSRPVRPAEATTLEQASQTLAQAALQKPGFYLPALRALRTLAADARAGRRPCATCLPVAERALTDLLPMPRPASARPTASDRMARRYFEELSR
jgi:hypothetical protein